MNLFIQLLFGHFIGDFFLQSKATAVNKSASNKVAVSHVAIYTLCVMVFTLPIIGLPKSHDDIHWLLNYFLWIAVIFVPHFIIDRFSLADAWLNLINGRALNDFLWNGNDKIPQFIPKDGKEVELTTDNEFNYLILRGGFTCIVYVVVDNVAHLMCLWYGFNLIFK